MCTNKGFIILQMHSPTHKHTALLGQVVRWCFELLMKMGPVPGKQRVGGGGGGVGFLCSETEAASHLEPKLLTISASNQPAGLSQH